MRATTETIPTYTQSYHGYILQTVGKGVSSRCYVWKRGKMIAKCLDARDAKAWINGLAKR